MLLTDKQLLRAFDRYRGHSMIECVRNVSDLTIAAHKKILLSLLNSMVDSDDATKFKEIIKYLETVDEK